MSVDEYYEDFTQQEADFLIDMYESISRIVGEERPVTLVGIAHHLNVRAIELSDYLPQIITILDQVEQENKIRQGAN